MFSLLDILLGAAGVLVAVGISAPFLMLRRRGRAGPGGPPRGDRGSRASETAARTAPAEVDPDARVVGAADLVPRGRPRPLRPALHDPPARPGAVRDADRPRRGQADVHGPARRAPPRGGGAD